MNLVFLNDILEKVHNKISEVFYVLNFIIYIF